MKQNGTWDGSVTVFFSLLFTLLLSFSLTFYQTAANAARGAFELSAAKLAVESFFAAYHYPLYEMYHIFGRSTEGRAAKETGEEFMQRLVIADLQEMTAARQGSLSLLRRGGAAVEVLDTEFLTDQDGALFFQEAVAYMKYETIADFFRIFEEREKESVRVQLRLEFMEQKTQVDQAYAVLEEDFISLIKLIDGVDLEKYEKYLGGKKSSFMQPYFVKYFSVYPGDAAKAYFKREDIYAAYQNICVNPQKIIESMQKEAEEGQDLSEEQIALRQRMEQLKEWEMLLLEELEQEDALENPEETRAQLLWCEQERRECSEKEKEIGRKIKNIRKRLCDSQKDFLQQCSRMAVICEETRRILEGMVPKLSAAKGKRNELQNALDEMELLDAEEIIMWQQELEEYDCYEKKDAYDFEQMQHTIEQNHQILIAISDAAFSKEWTFEEAVHCMNLWYEKIGGYSFEGLVLEYGETAPAVISLEEAEQTIYESLSGSLLSLLLVETVSDAVLQGKELPSEEYMEPDSVSDFSSLLSFASVQDVLHRLKTQHGDTLAESTVTTMLFEAYLKDHFQNYQLRNTWDGAVLQYEQEYLLEGNRSDRENLTRTALQMILTRMALHFSSILTNGQKRAEAEQAAIALAGITGMPALKYVATTVFLIVWAFEEAVLDTAAFLAGKKRPVYPGATGGCIAFSELLLFNRSLVAAKVEIQQEAGGVLLDYTDYLQILLFAKGRAKLCYQALDLIQENLRKAGDQNFMVKHCICSATIQKDSIVWEYQY